MYHLMKSIKEGPYKEIYMGGKVTENGLWQRNGFGLQLFPNGCFYVGYWKEDKAEGEGKLVLKDGTYYEGIY